MGRRKGCRHCIYRYFDYCRYCNILELEPNSELMLAIIVLKHMRR